MNKSEFLRYMDVANDTRRRCESALHVLEQADRKYVSMSDVIVLIDEMAQAISQTQLSGYDIDMLVREESELAAQAKDKAGTMADRPIDFALQNMTDIVVGGTASYIRSLVYYA